jgi:hypothetical protein
MRLTILEDEVAEPSAELPSHRDPIKHREAQLAVEFHRWLADKQILPGGLVVDSPQQLTGELAQRLYALKLLVVSEPTFDLEPLLVRSRFHFFESDYRQSLGFTIAVRTFEDANNRIHLLTWYTYPPRIQSQLAYYRGAHGAIYVYDVLKKKALSPWPALHDLFLNITGPIPAILVGHKEGSKGRRQITRKQGTALADKLGVQYYETRNPKGPTLDKPLRELVPLMLHLAQTRE